MGIMDRLRGSKSSTAAAEKAKAEIDARAQQAEQDAQKAEDTPQDAGQQAQQDASERETEGPW